MSEVTAVQWVNRKGRTRQLSGDRNAFLARAELCIRQHKQHSLAQAWSFNPHVKLSLWFFRPLAGIASMRSCCVPYLISSSCCFVKAKPHQGNCPFMDKLEA